MACGSGGLPPDATVRLEAINLQLKQRGHDAKVIDGANRAVLALNPANELIERTRVWPTELAAQRLAASDDSVRALIDDMRAVQGSDRGDNPTPPALHAIAMSDDRELRDELERLQAEARSRTGRLQEAESTAARLANELQRVTAERDRLAELLIALRSGRPVAPAARQGRADGCVFRGGAHALGAVLEEARAFARRFPPELLLDITLSDDRDEAVVVVWHVGPPRPDGAPLTPLSFELIESPSHQRWETSVDRTAEAISRLGADRLVCVAHIEDANRGTIALWYWGD